MYNFKGKPITDFISESDMKNLVDMVTDDVMEKLESLVKVKNLHHGTDEGSRYIRQWEVYKKKKNTHTRCANLGCKNEEKNPALVGAHVIKVDSSDNAWYICPLCHKCNDDNNDDIMTVYGSDLAPFAAVKNIPL